MVILILYESLSNEREEGDTLGDIQRKRGRNIFTLSISMRGRKRYTWRHTYGDIHLEIYTCIPTLGEGGRDTLGERNFATMYCS